MAAQAAFALRLLLFGLTCWLGLYLLARDARDPRLRWTGLGLLAYGAALALAHLPADANWPAWPVNLLMMLPAVCWAGGLLGFLPPTPRREQMTQVWRWGQWPLVALAALLSRGALTPWLALVVLGPLLAAFGLVAGHAQQARTRSAVALLLVATILVFLSTALFFFFAISANTLPLWVQAALGLDLLLLGYAVAALDAFEQGEGLALHMARSLDGALLAALLFGGPVMVTGWLATGWSPAMVALLYTIVAMAIVFQVLGPQLETAVDRFAFRGRDALQDARADLRTAAADLPRVTADPGFDWRDEAALARHTRRALSYLGNLPRLAASPLTTLPIVVQRAAGSGEDHTLARAAALRSLLLEAIERLRPAGSEPGFGDEWRYYNALYYPYVVGLKPYQRRGDGAAADPAHREALAWFQSQVPERTLYNWQTTAAGLVAQYLREMQQSSLQEYTEYTKQ